MKIGVLALQGAFIEHERILKRCGVETRQVRLPHQLEGLDALVIPGGESTTMGKLMNDFGFFEPVLQMARSGMPVFGTCAGMVMMAKEINQSEQPRLGLMDIEVKRNAFGRQVDSFEADLSIPALGPDPYRGVFIRAPYVTKAGRDVEILARYEEKIVFVRQGVFLAAAFHPELTQDTRVHEYFLNFCR